MKIEVFFYLFFLVFHLFKLYTADMVYKTLKHLVVGFHGAKNAVSVGAHVIRGGAVLQKQYRRWGWVAIEIQKHAAAFVKAKKNTLRGVLVIKVGHEIIITITRLGGGVQHNKGKSRKNGGTAENNQNNNKYRAACLLQFNHQNKYYQKNRRYSLKHLQNI